MAALFSDCPQAMSTTLDISEKCHVEFDFSTRHLPKFPLPDGEKDEMSYLASLARQGLTRRYRDVTSELSERLNNELVMIEQMGFAGYFLIVSDFIRYAHSIGVAVGLIVLEPKPKPPATARLFVNPAASGADVGGLSLAGAF